MKCDSASNDDLFTTIYDVFSKVLFEAMLCRIATPLQSIRLLLIQFYCFVIQINASKKVNKFSLFLIYKTKSQTKTAINR